MFSGHRTFVGHPALMAMYVIDMLRYRTTGRSERANEVDSPRERILDVALRLFDERGYAATSMEAIRVAAGFRTKSSLYAHFPSKGALTHALFCRVLERETTALAPYLADVETASLCDLLGLAEHLVA